MNVTIFDHLLYIDGTQVPFVATPNKGGVFTPQYIIEHFTGSTSAEGSISWFKSPNAKASAHLLIGRDGKVWQFAPLNVVTWHAGKSEWKDIIGLNSHAIGIEHVNAGKLYKNKGAWFSALDKKKVEDFLLVGDDAWQTYTDEQIATSKAIAEAIVANYDIKEILGHEQIAPGRKVDPGPAFPYETIREVLKPADKKTTTTVNVRSGPGIDFLVVEKLQPNTVVNIIDEKNGWYYLNIRGWVSAQFVK